MFIKRLGSAYIDQLKWRGMWVFIVQRLGTRNIVYGESFQDAPNLNQWARPVRLHVTAQLVAENIVNCKWDDSDATKRRREFCEKYEGYGNVCNCKYIYNLSCHWEPVALQKCWLVGHLKLVTFTLFYHKLWLKIAWLQLMHYYLTSKIYQ